MTWIADRFKIDKEDDDGEEFKKQYLIFKHLDHYRNDLQFRGKIYNPLIDPLSKFDTYFEFLKA